MDGEASESTPQRRRSPAEVLANIKRAQLFRIAIGYAVAAWLMIQVAATISPAFDAPPWLLRLVVLVAAAGFVVTIGVAAISVQPQAGGESVAKRRKFWRLLIGGALLAALITAGTFVTRGTGLVFGEQKLSLAVLPFTDLSPGRDKAFFAEGVAEEILSALATEPGIKVLGRTSARQIERNPNPKAIRASLGVTHLLEGSTRTAGNQLRVNVRLIDTSDGSQMWEEEYRGKLADVFGVQDKIATTVVRRLKGTFFENAVMKAKPTSVDAYQTYLAARALMNDPRKESLTQAWHMARQIVDAHPDYARGHALLASATYLLADGPYTYGDFPADKARRVAIAQAREAIRLAPDEADGYVALGLASPQPDSLAPLQKAIALDRSRASLRDNLGIDLNLLGRHDEAFEQYRLGVEIDPLSTALNNRYVASLAASGRAEAAFRAIDTFVRRSGDEAQAWRFRGNTLNLTGDVSGSIAARRRALALDPELPYQHEWLAIGLYLLGLDEQAARYSPRVSRYFQLFVADDRGALKAQIMRDGARAWSANGLDSAVFSLARARDWPAIVRLYDVRPADHRDICMPLPRYALFIAMALRPQERGAEAAHILGCIQRSVNRQLAMSFRSPDDAPGEPELLQASLLALRGDRRAFDWLDKAVARGWLGQYYSTNLHDWPQFDALRDEPRYSEIQRRIDARIARERAETLKLFRSARG